MCFNLGVAVLALNGGSHFASERMHHVLQPVAYAEHGQAHAEHSRVGERRVFIVDRRRAPGQNDAHRQVAAEFFERHRAGKHDGEDMQFADPTRDELGILRAKVEDDDGLGFHG